MAILRFFLVFALIGAGWSVLHQLVAQRVAAGAKTLQSLESALAWESQEPQHHFQLGLLHLEVPDFFDSAKAQEHLETAAQLNPHYWRHWLELGRSYEISGQYELAEEAYLEAVTLNPRSGHYRWLLANYYLRRGLFSQTIEHLESALHLDSELREQSFHLLRQTSGLEQIEAIWPKDPDSQLALLRLLATSQTASDPQAMSLFKRLWKNLMSGPEPVRVHQGAFALHYLLQQPQEARQAWLLLTEHNGLLDRAYCEGGNSIWNGDFEIPLSGGVLDWRVPALKGRYIERLEGTGLSGKKALKMSFDGTVNLGSAGLEQLVIVEPGQQYEVSFTAQSERITTERGIFLQIRDGNSSRVLAETEEIKGTTPCLGYHTSFQVPDTSQTVWLRFKRIPSSRIDNQISGSLWLDGFEMKTVTDR